MAAVTTTPDLSLNIHQNHAKIRAEIDAQVAALKAQIISLLFARNTSIPIALLPAEVLEKIFQFFKTMQYKEPNKLLTLTWVCSHWRMVALNYGRLWTYVDCTNARWAGECLQRSRSLPLTVQLPAQSPVL
ncbi:hypothetical protein BDN72DRAFT_780655, partial [Pluteus cervinus]